jgi:hypothetical protein
VKKRRRARQRDSDGYGVREGELRKRSIESVTRVRAPADSFTGQIHTRSSAHPGGLTGHDSAEFRQACHNP